jgi:pimeloyl-ACP methyl ester carboxylesterase
MKIASLSLRDYTDDLATFVNSLDSPPLLIGHSMGGLLAQLVAARTRHAGLVAACPAPAAGILGTTRTTLRMSLPHLLRPRSWTKPWQPPTFEQLRRWIANTQTEEIAREIYDGFVCESGRYLWELLLAVPKLSKANFVDFAAITAPVLVMGAECDRIVPAVIVRRTAARYQHGTSVEIPRSDHRVFSGAALPITMSYIEDWMARNHVLAADAAN